METEETPAPLPPEGALTVAPVEGAAPFILHDPAALAAQLATYGEARKLLVDWLLSQLVAGIDYTLIHKKIGPRGAKVECPNRGDMTARSCAECGGKSTLCKPGSEKLCGLLQLRPRFARDIETWEMLGSEPGVVALKCELVTAAGVVVAEGRGARHRDMDYGDLNKTVKMVQKSAQTDAVLRCAGLSEIFTQDLEDMPTVSNGDAAEDFQTPKRKTEVPAPAVPAETLQSQLRRSVEAAASVRAEREGRTAAPAPRGPAPRAPQPAPRPTRPMPARGGPQSASAAPPDALSPARVNRLMALVHEAIRGAEVPEEQHEGVFADARHYLVEWVGRTQGRDRLSDCSWKAYDELCAQVPAAVDFALGAEGPPPPRAPRPRLVRRSYDAPKPFARRGY